MISSLMKLKRRFRNCFAYVHLVCCTGDQSESTSKLHEAISGFISTFTKPLKDNTPQPHSKVSLFLFQRKERNFSDKLTQNLTTYL